MRSTGSHTGRSVARGVARLMTLVLVAIAAAPASAAEPNTTPIAVDDPGVDCAFPTLGSSYPIPEDWAEPFALTLQCAPLRNDIDADGDLLTAELVTAPEHGDATVWHSGDPTFNGATYLPDLDYSTPAGDEPGGSWVSDQFTYRVTDGQAWSEPATYRIWVAPVNDAPSFASGPDIVEVDQDSGPYSGPWASDIDPGPFETGQEVHFEVTDVDLHGLSHLFDVDPAIAGDGTLTFTPGLHEAGLATVTVRAVDDGGLEDWNSAAQLREQPDDTSDEVTFDIVVWPNTPPDAVVDDGLIVYQGPGASTLDPLANDTDPDGDALRIVSVTQAQHGVVSVVQNGAFVTYDPADGFVGQDWFQYTIEDGRGGTAGPMFVVIDVRSDTVTPKMGALSRSLPGQTIGSSTVVASLAWSATDVGLGVAGYQVQVSVNGAGYRAVPLANPAATTLRTTMTVGSSYAYRIRAADRAGNIGGYAYWPAVTPTRYQESSSIVTYSGTWSRAVDSHHSGGAARYATSSTRRVTATFTGREVAWVATKRATGGRAQVRIDGVLVATVDLGAGSTQYRRIVFRRGFTTRATHTIEIRPLGDGRVDLDAIIVLR